jgi:hypothetical protein
MDDDLKHKFAPRRNKRYAHLRGFNEEAGRADTLDWKNNDYDFYRLTQSILDHLDSDFRERWGLRIDQLADKEEIHDCFRRCRTWYQQEEHLFQTCGVYVFLHANVELWLGGKACDALDRRRDAAERLTHESNAASCKGSTGRTK